MASITEQIVSLATALGATASGNYTISSAIDLLADTLAGSDQSQQATIAAALGELSGKIAKVPSGTISITENGEGIDVSSYATADVAVSGGASVGGLVPIYEGSTNPQVGDSLYESADISSLYLGDSPIMETTTDVTGAPVARAAVGVKCTTMYVSAFNTDADNPVGAIVTVDTSLGYNTIGSIQQWDGVTLEKVTDEYDNVMKRYVFTVPELQSGQAVYYAFSYPD